MCLSPGQDTDTDRLERPEDTVSTGAVIFFLAVVVFLAFTSCKTWPAVLAPSCDRTGAMEAHTVNASYQDCLECPKARNCTADSNQWCCDDALCSTCTVAPVNLEELRKHMPHDMSTR